MMLQSQSVGGSKDLICDLRYKEVLVQEQEKSPTANLWGVGGGGGI